MKLVYRITSRISVALLVVMAVWATVFYFIIVEETNDETDDLLEDYSENIITRALAGEPLPSKDNGTNNSYHITEVSTDYTSQHPAIRYYDEMVYIQSKGETEPARILKTIFRDEGNNYYELTVSFPTIEKSDLLEAILYWIIILYVGLLAVIIVLNWIILQRSFKPLYKLLDWLKFFSVEKRFSEPDIHTKTTEFRKLNNAIVQNAKRNIEIYEQQKSFIENASHELQTPLAVCLNRLEMLAEDPLLTEKQLEEILKTKQSLNHAVKLNKTLLLFTKIENNQFPGKVEIRVNELLKKLMDDYSEVYGNHHISVSYREETQVKMEMDESLATVLLGNLLKNAFVHNLNNGSIEISITNTSVSIANSGLDTALNPDIIFNRFYQLSKKESSAGLGLALAKSICSLYGMYIHYDFLNKKHIFSLFLH